MRTFIQLKNGIGYATVNTTGEPDHSITPNDTNAVEVFTDNPEQFLKKIYNSETNTWLDAPIIRFSEINEFGDLIEIKTTVFIHEVPQSSVQLPNEANMFWKFINNEWISPQFIEPAEQTIIEPAEQTISENI